jgi:hypothetical protein
VVHPLFSEAADFFQSFFEKEIVMSPKKMAGGGRGGAYYSPNISIPSDKKGAIDWWRTFAERNSFPMYCVLLSHLSDVEVTKLVTDYSDELDAISGNDCCFILFRDLEKAKYLSPFQYAEHIKWVPVIAQAVGARNDELPSLLFFKDLDHGDYVLYKLGNKSTEEIIGELRQIFQVLSTYKDPRKKLNALRRLRNCRRLIPGLKRVSCTLSQIGTKVVATILDEMIKKHIP